MDKIMSDILNEVPKWELSPEIRLEVDGTISYRYKDSTDAAWKPLIHISEINTTKIMIQKIKDLRVKIDGLYQLTKDLKPLTDWKDGADSEPFEYPYNSKEIEDSAKSLILAKAWLGKLLGELGNDNPYSRGKKEVKDIEPTADVDINNTIFESSTNIEFWGKDYAKLNHIEKVDWIRTEIQSVIDKFDSMDFLSRNKNNAHDHLGEAKIWLGFEFARIKKEHDE